MQPQAADAVVRPVITRVKPTGRVGSAASAAAGYFIPGPLGLRVPGFLGGLTVEAEMLGPDGAQVAALVWNRDATPIGTDDPSLSRIGDALQFAAPFADTAAAVMSPAGARPRAVPRPDPCAEYGPRFRPEGLATKVITGLYVPQASRARPVVSAGVSAPPPPSRPAPARAPSTPPSPPSSRSR